MEERGEQVAGKSEAAACWEDIQQNAAIADAVIQSLISTMAAEGLSLDVQNRLFNIGTVYGVPLSQTDDWHAYVGRVEYVLWFLANPLCECAGQC